jgi:hypothetical protein
MPPEFHFYVAHPFQNHPDFENYLHFYEYFHGDTGRGVGASHQTGWTGLIAKLAHPRARAGFDSQKEEELIGELV